MASLAQHERDTLKWLGSESTEVHKWLDEYFATAGSTHRKFRHHDEGIREAGEIFGDGAAEAATVHILRDCRNIPRSGDYESGVVDALGLRKEWPIAAYATYTEEAFSALVQYKLKGPTGILLWAFIGQEVAPLLPNLTTMSPEEIKDSLGDWERAVSLRNSLPALAEPDEPSRPLHADLSAFVNGLSQQPVFDQIRAQFGGFEIRSVPTDYLVTSLALIDYEYVEELRPELQGDDELSVVKFALPHQVAIPIKAAPDPSTKSVSLISRQKSLFVSGVQVNQTPMGIEVRFLVASGAALIIVSRIGNRLYLRSGIHRAFLLASMGVKRIPCVVVQENVFSPISSNYPSFSNDVLTHPRPPLLRDFFDESLSLTTPLQRTNKVIRISAEDLVIPVL